MNNATSELCLSIGSCLRSLRIEGGGREQGLSDLHFALDSPAGGEVERALQVVGLVGLFVW